MATTSNGLGALGQPSGVSVIVPVYNGEATVGELVARLQAVLSGLRLPFEVILVNDGSKDASLQRICELAERVPYVTGIDLMRNYGQHNALLAGVRVARHDAIVTVDDDLQHPPEEIPKLLARLAEGWDVVYGRPERERHELWRVLASQITKWVLETSMGAEVARSIGPFRAFRTRVRDAFADYRGPFVSIDVLLTWGTERFSVVPVEHDQRRSGTSTYTFRKLVTHALNLMTGFSTLPLQLASILGFGLTLLGAILLLYVIGRYIIEGGSVPGFPFLASAIIIFSGAELFALGIIGEYLARMHFRMMERPTYMIRRRIERAGRTD